MNIGEKIKQLRVKMSLTQEELANRCELSKGFISQVERDLNSPSIATLVAILESLGTNLKDFFNDSQQDKIVFHKEDVYIQENLELGHKISWIVPNSQKNKIEPILISLEKSGKSKVYDPHQGEIFGYVLSGSINIFLGARKFKAKKGESFYYNATTTHYIENASNLEATILWLSTPPNF